MIAVREQDSLPLEDFVRLEETADFQVPDTPAFRKYAEDRPYLHPGGRIGDGYIVVYTLEDNIPAVFDELGGDFLRFTPKILSPVDSNANDRAGITRVLSQPFLDLTGSGVLIGFVDTGIDYTLDAFRFEDGSTRIEALWDQTTDGEREGVYFGSTYDREQINEALSADTPLSVIPSFDENGHGTFLASVAASGEAGEYIGAAPLAGLICVKLRHARPYYVRRFLLPEDSTELYESTDMLLGIEYMISVASKLGKPLVVCIGMGSNTSAHDGSEPFEDYISSVSRRTGFAFAAAAGNEANARRHTSGTLNQGRKESISIKVSSQGSSFGTIVFLPSFDKISASLLSPTGEVVAPRPFESGKEYSDSLVLENTKVHMRFSRDSYSAVWVGLEQATQGTWEIILTGGKIIDGRYHAWLPVEGQISGEAEFLRPDPEYTIVYPACARRILTCGAYNSFDGSLLVSSSWGPTLLPEISPDLVAPGVRIGGIYPEGKGSMTGTSVSAALTAGAAALLMEWGIVKGNMPDMNGETMRALLIGGADRDTGVDYPNNKWGYGRLDLYGVFEFLRNRG